jgi:hypothetical protein
MAILTWVIAITGIAIGLGVIGIWADLFAPPNQVGIAVELIPYNLWRGGDWQTVWQMYAGAQYL